VIEELGPDLGMDLNLKKNELVKFVLQDDPFPAEFERFYFNFNLLGSPIGEEKFCTEYITKHVRKRVGHVLESLLQVKDTQVYHFLTRLCASFCKVVHLLRSVPPSYSSEALLYFDAEFKLAFTRGTGVIFTDDAWAQAVLPIGMGGAGVRQVTLHAAGAYVASVARCASSDGWDPSLAVGWTEALADVCGRSGRSPESVMDGMASISQRELSQAVDKTHFDALIKRSPVTDRARLRSVSARGASAWLGVIPSSTLGLAFNPREFTVLLRFWLGLPIYEAEHACPGCGQAMGRYGGHALSCKHMGTMTTRHNAIREVFMHYCKLANIKAVREAPGLLPDSAARPADILLPNQLIIPGLSSDLPTCLDFAVTNTQQPKNLKRAGEVSATAADDYATSVKIPTYRNECKANGLDFVPMVVEVFGAWGSAAKPVIDFISKAVANNKNKDQDQVDSFLRQAVSVTLQRYNVAALLRRSDPECLVLDGPVPDFSDNY